MAIYTLSMNYIDGVGNNQSHLHNVFLQFSNPESEHKVAIDRSKRLLALYSEASKYNNDLYTWLDFMSRSKNRFEIINVEITEATDEEEVYLKVAKNTRPSKKIIVDSHQFYKNFVYKSECNRILYDGIEITVLDKDEAYRELHLDKLTITIPQIQKTMAKKNNPWTSGSFYLVVGIIFIVLPTGLIFLNILPLFMLPISIIGGILSLSIVGALQLKNDAQFSEEGFLKLMGISLSNLALLKFFRPKSKK